MAEEKGTEGVQPDESAFFEQLLKVPEELAKSLQAQYAAALDQLRRGQLDHVGIAVKDAKAAAKVYEALGLTDTFVEEVPTEGARITFLMVGLSRLEFLEPLGPDTVIGKFLEKRGEGIHHIALSVEDIEASLKAARGAGLEIVGEAPRKGASDRLVAFIHPRSANGVLVELVQNPP